MEIKPLSVAVATVTLNGPSLDEADRRLKDGRRYLAVYDGRKYCIIDLQKRTTCMNAALFDTVAECVKESHALRIVNLLNSAHQADTGLGYGSEPRNARRK